MKASLILYLRLGFNVVLMSLGQLLFKKAALFMSNKEMTLSEKYILNPWLWFAVIIYGFTTILWVYILTNMKLNIAYPIVIGLSYSLTLYGAYFFFGESLGVLGGIGVVLILVGVICASL